MGMFTMYQAADSMAFDEVCKNKTRKQVRNAFRILYGKKKDRGHLKQKLKGYADDKKQIIGVMNRAMEKRFGYSFDSLLSAFGGGAY